MELDVIVKADALEFMAGLPSASVDMCLVDLPYGTTACSWDEIIPFAPMWEQFRRVTKPRAAIVLTASQPFTSKLVMSNLKMFRYEWIWEKDKATGFLDVDEKPLKAHESILTFGKEMPNYYAQKTYGHKPVNTPGRHDKGTSVYRSGLIPGVGGSTERFPRSVQYFNTFNSAHGIINPTQKPVALFEYLIRTYTQAGDVVLDCCMGSGTTAVAARQCGRRFVGCDSDAGYVKLANDRLAKPWQPMLLEFA